MMIFCCFIFTGVCTGSPHVQPCGDLADQLAELKAQLGQAVADIENLEKDLKERAQPQTVAEVEELERKLEAAMAELKKQKSELEKE
jgi:serine/threonine protein kinase HipA of HipAB toxin-antitoxin module